MHLKYKNNTMTVQILYASMTKVSNNSKWLQPQPTPVVQNRECLQENVFT